LNLLRALKGFAILETYVAKVEREIFYILFTVESRGSYRAQSTLIAKVIKIEGKLIIIKIIMIKYTNKYI